MPRVHADCRNSKCRRRTVSPTANLFQYQSSRSRTCTEPAPRNGGAHCFGEATEARTCLVSFCPVNGAWGAWTPWSSCTATCGAGLSQRQRRCDNPPPSNGGKVNVRHCVPLTCCFFICWFHIIRECMGVKYTERTCSSWSWFALYWTFVVFYTF